MAAKKDKAKNTTNRLVGWLVSFGIEESGFSYEIRAGRCFVGSAKQDGLRILTVDESSVSTPHLAMKASAKHRVMVQDVFSEHGSFITRDGKTKEELISGPTELRHGDWLRVGKNTRFQVCLIDGPNSK